jgi:acyl carrier protein
MANSDILGEGVLGMDVHRDVRDFVVKNFLYGDQNAGLGESDSLIEKGIIDSTGVLEIVNFLESRFGIVLSDNELVPDNLDSIERMARFVHKKQSELVASP